MPFGCTTPSDRSRSCKMRPKASSAVTHTAGSTFQKKTAIHKDDESMHINIKGPIFGTVITSFANNILIAWRPI
jgi:hypothetical protein